MLCEKPVSRLAPTEIHNTNIVMSSFDIFRLPEAQTKSRISDDKDNSIENGKETEPEQESQGSSVNLRGQLVVAFRAPTSVDWDD